MKFIDFLTEYSSLVSVVAVALLTTFLAWKEKKSSRINQLEIDKKEIEKTMNNNQLECLNNRLTQIEKEYEHLRRNLDDINNRK